MTKRFAKNGIYAFSMLLIAIFRIMVSEGVLSGFSVLGSDAVWSVVVQVGFMGVVPLLLYVIYLKFSRDKHALKTIAAEFKYDSLPANKSWVYIFLISIFATFMVTCLSNVWYNLISVIGYTPSVSKPLVYDNIGVLIADIALIPSQRFFSFPGRGR